MGWMVEGMMGQSDGSEVRGCYRTGDKDGGWRRRWRSTG